MRWSWPMQFAAGDVFSEWTVLTAATAVSTTKIACRCSCGTERQVQASSLQYEISTNCGCARRRHTAALGKSQTKHGMFGTRTYASWSAMRDRCDNPKSKDYENYGGRGIAVCARWKNFEAFLADMGERPAGKTLERREVNGDYTPENCKWATPIEQALNRRTTRWLRVGGEQVCLAEAARRLGWSGSGLASRLAKLPLTEALITNPRRST